MSAQNSSAPQPKKQLDTEDVQDDGSAPDEGEEETGTEELSLDLIFEILKNRRRRDVIRFLHEQEDRTALGDLAEHVAALENDTTTQALTSSQRKRVYVGLYQCHLPKMDDMDIVDFNQDRGYVELGENVDQLAPYLDPADDTDRPWHQYYLGVSALGVVAVLAAVLAGPAALVSQILLGVVVTAFVGCALFHTATVTADD